MLKPLNYWIAIFLFVLIGLAFAQGPKHRYPQGWVRVEGNTLTFCYSEQETMNALHQDVARSIARTLGVNAAFYPYHEGQTEGRALVMSRNEFVILLTDYCDVFMGLPRSVNATFDYPADEQQLSTRPYMEVEYLLVTRDPELTSLRDLSEGTPVALEFASLPLMFLATVRPDLERVTFERTVGSRAQLDALASGEQSVGIVWGPSLYQAYPDPEGVGLHVHSIDDLPNMSWFIVGSISRERTSLRTQVDQAIERLIRNGTIDEILADYALPERYFSAGPVKFETEAGDDRDEAEEELGGIDFSDYGYDEDTGGEDIGDGETGEEGDGD